MAGPYYNSRATKISVVVEGEGFFEMACPHLSSSSGSYQKVSARLRRGMVFVAPAGHPVAVIASQNNNLQVLCFEVNAHGNSRFPLAGIS
jgi:mannose-6-phosphate isomerase-like protein (cupin superfamily)